MGASSGRSDTSLEEALFERGFEFDFFQAVRLLARIFQERESVGGPARPSEEIVRFRAWQSLAFPASAIDYIEGNGDRGSPVRMTVTFLSLTGIQGVLPVYYTDRMIAAKGAKNEALADFFDIFNHRLVSLFFRAWQKHRPPVLYESAALEGRRPDLFTHSLFDLIGMGTQGLRGRMRIDDERLLLYSGLIAQRPHSASALEGILRDYFSIPIQIDQFLGSWYELEDPDRCYLAPEAERNQIGVGAFLGDKVWDQQARFRIRAGPMSLARFRDFLPGGGAIEELKQLTRYLAGQALAFDVQLVLRAPEVPDLRLTDKGPEAPRLAWTSWLKTSEFQYDAGDAVFAYLN
ncbi:MAG: type VI secretion system baseplate subunit TssG [Bryobacteraceae bacterium]